MRSTSRVVSVALATVLTLAACGSDESSDPAPTETTAVVDTTVADTTVVESTVADTTPDTTSDTATTSAPDEAAQDVEADTAAAEASFVTVADLPEGWTEGPADDAAASLRARLAECVDVDGDEISAADAAAATGTFLAPEANASLRQHVGVLSVETDARRVVAFFAEPGAPACFEEAYAELGGEALGAGLADGAETGTPTASRLQVGSAGDATQAIRVVVPVTGDPAVTEVTVDHVIVRSGRSVATLTFTSSTATTVEAIDAVTSVVAERLPA
jgi:hypothetical protein